MHFGMLPLSRHMSVARQITLFPVRLYQTNLGIYFCAERTTTTVQDDADKPGTIISLENRDDSKDTQFWYFQEGSPDYFSFMDCHSNPFVV